MPSKFRLDDSYEVISEDANIVKYEKYHLKSNSVVYKIFVKNSKITILKEIKRPSYRKLSEEEVDAFLMTIKDKIDIFEQSEEYTGAPEISDFSTIMNFDEDDEESYDKAKKLLRHKEKQHE